MDAAQRLYEACFAVARTNHWKSRPVDLALIQQYAEKLFKEAKTQVESAESLGGSIEVVIRAVRYIEQAHAIPPLEDNVAWFADTLQTLMEIVYPNTEVHGEAAEFLVDMQGGISSFMRSKLR
jgi:hypothetical protein